MSGTRVIEIEIAIDPTYSEWQIVVKCPKGKEVTPQEVIDAIADAMLNEGELDPFTPRDPGYLDS